jgi:arabinogalactan endo-1,4-beta-galactosidase
MSTHLSQSLSPGFASAFYEAMASGGFEADVLGFSFYPSATDIPNRAEHFRETVSAVSTALSRPVFIAEYGYPANTKTTGTYATWTHAIPNYPLTEAGQAALIHDLAAWGSATGLTGIRPWAPEVFLEGWQGFALFEAGAPAATARDGLDGIAQGIAHPDATAFRDE